MGPGRWSQEAENCTRRHTQLLPRAATTTCLANEFANYCWNCVEVAAEIAQHNIHSFAGTDFGATICPRSAISARRNQLPNHNRGTSPQIRAPSAQRPSSAGWPTEPRFIGLGREQSQDKYFMTFVERPHNSANNARTWRTPGACTPSKFSREDAIRKRSNHSRLAEGQRAHPRGIESPSVQPTGGAMPSEDGVAAAELRLTFVTVRTDPRGHHSPEGRPASHALVFPAPTCSPSLRLHRRGAARAIDIAHYESTIA